MNTCKTCFWWSDEPNPYYRYVDRRQCHAPTNSPEMVDELGGHDEDSPMAVGSTDPFVGAYLETKPNFSCNAWKEKEKEE